MSVAIVIPARLGSTRLPEKLLLAETGKPLLQHTYERAVLCGADAVVVATDHDRIRTAVTAFGGDVVMTRADHSTGSARVAEAAARLPHDIIVNLQGDEPEIDPAAIGALVDAHRQNDVYASTLACRFPATSTAGAGSPSDPAAVKAILGERLRGGARRAVYFTRRACPYAHADDPARYFLHIGVYAFHRETLTDFAKRPRGALEAAENLEQLRILEAGEAMAVALIDAAAPGIDTREDYDAFVGRIRAG